MAGHFIINGGRSLKGEIGIHGSKNAATKMMIAALLTPEPCTLENVPLSQEIGIARELCASIGAQIFLDQNHRCLIEAGDNLKSRVPELSRKNRIPILALGPLLHRNGQAEVPVLGGCPIGHRPVNFHVEALRQMGIKLERRGHSYFAKVLSQIHGAEIEFPYPSVGATENVILTAVLAEGKTIIRNSAIEPEILNLISMLNSMGARINPKPEERLIVIDGVAALSGVTARVMPDRTEAVSFAAAALATDGEILILDINERDIQSFLEKITELGAEFKLEPKGIRFLSRGSYRPLKVETAPHPGFMTDWQQPFAVLLTQAEGESIIHETVYEDRMEYLRELSRMGSRIEILTECPESLPCRFFKKSYRHSARIKGPTKLKGSNIVMNDIRAGMAFILASLAAQGKSVISGVEHIDRGYERIDERLQGLGADIQRI